MVSSSRRDGSEVKFEDTKNRKKKSYSTIEYADLKKSCLPLHLQNTSKKWTRTRVRTQKKKSISAYLASKQS